MLVLDQASKLLVVRGLGLATVGHLDLLPPWVSLRMAWNRGVNFGLLSHSAELMRWGLVAVALAVAAWVALWVRREQGGRLMQAAAGLLIGGAAGNALDRVLHGAVADFLNVTCCGIDNPYAFNLADIAIFAGALGLVLLPSGRGRPGRGGAGAKVPGGKASGAGTQAPKAGGAKAPGAGQDRRGPAPAGRAKAAPERAGPGAPPAGTGAGTKGPSAKPGAKTR